MVNPSPSPSTGLRPDLQRAERFLVESGRPVERHLFAALHRGASGDPVVAALAAHQNPDAGFGHGLEPRLRGPESQPLATQYAIEVAACIGALRLPFVARALDFLGSITRFSGGIPLVLPSRYGLPRDPGAPLPDPATAAIGPTASIAATLLEHQVWHPWLESASEFAWEAVGRITDAPSDVEPDALDFSSLEPLLRFLEYAREREPADRKAALLAQLVLEWDRVAFEPDPPSGAPDRPGPLDWAPRPASFGASLFTAEQLERHLDALTARQHPDGGWPPARGVPGQAAELESRSVRTLRAIGTLAAYGRL